jgi:hypothetical protein
LARVLTALFKEISMLIIVCWLTGAALAVAMVLKVVNGVVRAASPVFGPLVNLIYTLYTRAGR